MFVPRTGARLIAQPPVRDLASFASTRPSSSSLALLSQARCFTTPSVGRSRSLVLPLRLSMASQTGPGSLVLASAQLRRNFHSSQPLPVIRDSYYQDNRRRSNSRDGGRSPAPKGGWERLKRAFWDAVLRFERLPDNVVLALVIGPNLLVFLAWQASDFFHSPRLQRFLLSNFMLSDAHVRAGKWWTLLSYSFSHSEILHLGVNMFCLVSIAKGAISVIGNTRFVGLYLLTGLGGGLLSLLSRQFIDRKGPAYGASASIAGTLAFYGAAFPTRSVLVMFVLPVQLKYALSGWAAYDLFAEFYYKNQRVVDGSAHLGGIAAGVLFFLVLRRKYRW